MDPVGALVARVAEVIAILPSITNGTDRKGDAVIETLLSVISGLSKVARNHAHLEKLAAREQEASRLLSKFKKVARQQQEVIELHEAKLKDSATAQLQVEEQLQQLRLQQLAPPPPAPVPVSRDAQINTEVTHFAIAQMEHDCSLLTATLEALREKSAKCERLDEALRINVAQNRKLRIVVKRAQGVIEAQKVLLDGMDEYRRRAKSRTPSRESTPVREKFPQQRHTLRSRSAAPETPPQFPPIHQQEDDFELDQQEYEDEGEEGSSDPDGQGVGESEGQDFDDDESARAVWESQSELGSREIEVESSFDLIQMHYGRNHG